MAFPPAQAQPQQDVFVGRRAMILRHEFVRLLEQALYRLGYDEIAQQLETASVR